MKHPNKKQRDHQAKILAELPKEEREERARLFRFVNASFIYHTKAVALKPTETDFKEWLIGLPEDTRIDMEVIGFALGKDNIFFHRYVLEKNDIGMVEWLKEHLSEDDFNEYCKLIEARKKLDQDF